jgi:hypothetical protein
MYKNYKNDVLRSVMITPLLVSTLSFGSIDTAGMQSKVLAISSQSNTEEIQASTQEQITMRLRADKIDAYFRDRNMPLEGYGMKMVQVAEENNIDWRLLPAISVIETTGGKNICKSKEGANNPFGYGSCKIAFDNINESIEIVGRNLGGNNPRTASYYKNKDLDGVLKSYNSVIPTYNKKIRSVMDRIENYDISNEA